MPKYTCRSCGNNFSKSELLSVHTNEDGCVMCECSEVGDIGHEMQWICQDCYDDEENDNLTNANLQRDIDRGNGDLSDDSGDDE